MNLKLIEEIMNDAGFKKSTNRTNIPNDVVTYSENFKITINGNNTCTIINDQVFKSPPKTVEFSARILFSDCSVDMNDMIGIHGILELGDFDIQQCHIIVPESELVGGIGVVVEYIKNSSNNAI